jgi:hypothetical protein
MIDGGFSFFLRIDWEEGGVKKMPRCGGLFSLSQEREFYTVAGCAKTRPLVFQK